MTKKYQIQEIQKRLPEDIKFFDETKFELTEDEFVGILSWIKYFNAHFKKYGKNEHPKVIFPIISKRLRLDFGLYRFPSDVESQKGDFVIYLSENSPKQTVKKIINTWQL